MRTWFWTLFVLALAVGLALLLREHSGNVLIIAQPWRIELSLTLAILLILASFAVVYVCLRVLAWLIGGPERFRSWRGLRAKKRDHDLLEAGWINVLEGRYTQAEKELSKLLGVTKSKNTKVLAGLASARASHHLGEFTRRDEALKLAQDTAQSQPRLKEAVATAAAEMYLDQNRPEDALVLLQPLQDASSRHFNATRLLLRAHRQLHHHDRVYELTRLLLRRGAMDKTESLQLIETSTAARLRGGGLDSLKNIWGDLKADEKTLPDVALAAAAIHESAGNFDEAAKILEAAINVKVEPRLLNAYSQCPPEQVARRLSKAEVWLKNDPDNSALLAALGNLCLIGQLWGQGEHYLLRSMKIRSDVRIHALLGNLYDRLGRQSDAMKHWRLASGVAGVLPVLPMNQWLPAADTRGDPTLIDVEAMPEAHPIGPDPLAPLAASAADFDIDTSLEPGPAYVPPPVKQNPQKAAPDDASLDEYFDSAPIPGVDLSQTSDQPHRGSGRH
ncbi:MAG TPA: heme biosynthesis HemY N-terminal domain-containing protein [Eoetvoesiella sp.]